MKPYSLIKNLIKKNFAGSDEIILFQGKSNFRKITVVEKPISHQRVMYASNRLFVAGIDTRNNFPLYSPYFLADIVNPKPRSLLFLGGGPNAVPSYVWRNYKPDYIDVVERDELNTKLAEKYFGLPKNKNYRIFHQDATLFLKDTKKKYDIIYSDIGLTRKRGLSTKDMYPFCTLRTFKKLHSLLNKNGLLIYIVIGKLKGQDLVFERRCLASLNKYFPKVYTFSDFQEKGSKTQLILFLAPARNLDINESYTRLKNNKKLRQDENIYENLLAKMHKLPIIKPGLNPYT